MITSEPVCQFDGEKVLLNETKDNPAQLKKSKRLELPPNVRTVVVTWTRA